MNKSMKKNLFSAETLAEMEMSVMPKETDTATIRNAIIAIAKT